MPARSRPTSPGSPRPANASPQTFQLFATGSRQYLAVATIFGAGVALLDVVALTILDIRYAWLWGLLAFITNYIPNVGFIIGLIPPTIVALLDHDAKTALAVVIIYCVLNIIIQSVIQPRVVGSYRRPVSHPQLPLPDRLGRDLGRCRRVSRRPRHLVRQGPVH